MLVQLFTTIERIAIALSLGGILGKIMHWPGASMLLTMGLATLGMVYFYEGFMYAKLYPQTSETAPSKTRNLMAITVNIGSAIVSLAMLFKLQFWHGADGMLPVALLALAIGAMLSFKNKEANGSRKLMMRSAILGVLASVFMMLSFKDVAVFYYGDKDQMLIEKIIKVAENPTNQEYKKELEEYKRSKSL
jgi:dipeptide/tripeptide permease